MSSLHFHASARPEGFGFYSLELVLEFLGLEQLGGLCEGSVDVTGTPEPSVRTPTKCTGMNSEFLVLNPP